MGIRQIEFIIFRVSQTTNMRLSTKKIMVLFAIMAFVIVAAMDFFITNSSAQNYGVKGTPLSYHYRIDTTLPFGFNQTFAGSGECDACHQTAHGTQSMLDSNGLAVSPANDWRGTMMGNAARDPLWRAKVSHEVAVNPNLQVEIEHTCTKCHAPQGHYQAMYLGQQHYSIAEMENDPIALDGVSCTACHSQLPDFYGTQFSGNLTFDTTYHVYGPYPDPDTITMWNHINYVPRYDLRILNSELCATCHTLITQTVDLNGNPINNSFVEQATYHEWFNSDYELQNKECQSCHTPKINDSIVIANEPYDLEPRTPFWLHYFVGGNEFMLKILQSNIDTLNLTADSSHFAKTIQRTKDNLLYESLNLSLTEVGQTPDTAYFDLALENKAGHKFPSGYPSRRSYVQFVVLKANGDTLFQSGMLNNQFELVDIDPIFEPHYDVINSEDQVQIYQMIQGDLNGNVTTVLERAFSPLKDNRLPPLGFTTTHGSYDTVKIAGNALADADFNKVNSVEGSGTDTLHYHIPLNGYEGSVTVSARVYYQAVPPRWVENMFTFSTPEIDKFKWMYNNADQTPSLVGEVFLGSFVSITELEKKDIKIFPNPVTDGKVFIQSTRRKRLSAVRIYDLDGKLVQSIPLNKQTIAEIQMPTARSMYLLEVAFSDGSATVEKVIVAR
jgi:hypothetical protein